MLGFVGNQGFFNDAVAGTVVQIKNGKTLLSSLRLVNTTAAVAYLQIFSLPSASVTLGTTTPDLSIRLGANESLPLHDLDFMPNQGSGLSIAGTTTPAGNTGAAISVAAFFE